MYTKKGNHKGYKALSICICWKPVILWSIWSNSGLLGTELCINLFDNKDKCRCKVASETVVRNGHLVCLLGKKPDQDSETAELAHRAQNTSKLEYEGIYMLYSLRTTSSWNKNSFWPGILLWNCQHNWDCQSCPQITGIFWILSTGAGSAGLKEQKYQLRFKIGALSFLDCQSCPQNLTNTGTCSEID